MKYGSKENNFNLKLVMFYDVRNRVGLLTAASSLAFSIMLKGLALDYYYADLMH